MLHCFWYTAINWMISTNSWLCSIAALMFIMLSGRKLISHSLRIVPKSMNPSWRLSSTFLHSSNSNRMEQMGNSMRDTIFALSSGSSSGISGVAVVRISGPMAGLSLQYLMSKDLNNLSPLPKPRVASLRSLHCPISSDMLDKALVLWFEAPKSFTGEDVVELHLHGSRAVIGSIFNAFGAINDIVKKGVIRAAERGEFSRRAFENGKMDLTEVEGLADLLQAETAEQRKQALRQMEGSLKVKYDEWRY